MTTSRGRLMAVVLLGTLVACGKASTKPADAPRDTPPDTPPTPRVAGIAAPKEVSALPARAGAGVSVTSALLRAAALATDAGTDYTTAETVKFVDERALSRFSDLNTIFKALAETHYADPENVNQGPYGCMVTWEENGGSSTGKQLVPWVVDSRMTTDGAGRPLNDVHVWMKMNMGDGQLHVIRVDLRISEAPTQLADGSYADYGVWTIDAKFDGDGNGFYVASAARDGAVSVVTIHQLEPNGQETRGILRRSAASGYGAVSFPDWSGCHDPNCVPTIATVSYAYDADHAALEQGGVVVYKDRNAVVDLVNRYGLYDAATGQDVARNHAFGFPISWADAQGLTHWGYYGAWQGRHQLGSDGQNQIPAGSTVTRTDLPPNAPLQTFTVSAPYVGTLVKRTLVPGDLQGLSGIVVQTWVNRSFGMGYDGSRWLSCPDGQWLNLGGTYANPGVPVCSNGPGPGTAPTALTDLSSLVRNPNDPQQQVMINWNQACGYPCNTPPPPVYLVYDGTGFYRTDWTPSPGPMTQPTSNGIPWVPQAGDSLWVNLGGPIYLAWDGAEFVQKAVASFDQRTNTATFDPAGDRAYALDPSREYYFNTPGVNYVVRATGPAAWDVKVELQSVANPLTAGGFVPAGTTFRQQWDPSACATTCPSPLAQSTYRFDAASMKLVYACVSDGDQQKGARPGDAVTAPQWGLVAYDAQCARTGVQYNWDYPQDAQQGSFGTQQYLRRGDGSWVILEDPIRLAPIQLRNHRGDLLTLSLQFDGNWVQGLPDVYNELQANGYILTQAIADKVVVIPAGTEVIDASDGSKHYLFKPLQMNEYLAVIADPGGLDPSAADGLDLAGVRGLVDANLGDVPDVPVKYSEGRPVQ